MGDAKQRLEAGNYKFNTLKPGQQVEVDLRNATPRSCECGCSFFIPAVMVYTVSALVSPTGQELTANRPVLLCLDCKKPLT